MINGATAEDLEKEKAKLDRILKEQREKEEAENLVKKLAGSLSGVEKIEKQEKEDEELYRVKRPTKDRIEVQQKKPKGANSKACLIQWFGDTVIQLLGDLFWQVVLRCCYPIL